MELELVDFEGQGSKGWITSTKVQQILLYFLDSSPDMMEEAEEEWKIPGEDLDALRKWEFRCVHENLVGENAADVGSQGEKLKDYRTRIYSLWSL